MHPILGIHKRLTLIPQGIIIVLTAFLPIFAIISMFPALPSIIEHFSDNPNARELVPLMVSAPGLAIAALAPFAGYFVDRFGRLPLLLWSTFFYGIFGFAPFLLDNLTLMFFSRLCLGVCEAGILTVSYTLIGDYWDEEGRKDWYFLQGLAAPALGALAIWASGPITELRWNGIFSVYAFAIVLFFLMKIFLFEPDSSNAEAEAQEDDRTIDEQESKVPFPVFPMLVVALTTLFASAIYYELIISGGLAFNEMGITSPSEISKISAIPSLFVLLGAFIFRLISHYSYQIQLGSFFGILCAGITLIGLAESVPALVAGLVIQQTGQGMALGVLMTWTQSKLPFQHRGVGVGIWTSCFFFGQFSSPWLVTRIEQFTGSVQAAFVFSGAAGLILAVCLFATHVKIAMSTNESKPAPQN